MLISFFFGERERRYELIFFLNCDCVRIFPVEECRVQVLFWVDAFFPLDRLDFILSRIFCVPVVHDQTTSLYNIVSSFIYLLNECMKKYHLSKESLNNDILLLNTSTINKTNRKR